MTSAEKGTGVEELRQYLDEMCIRDSPNGSGKVEITGSLGDVMKESAHLALTYARVHADTYHIAPDKFKNTDIHIHAPEGAVHKDGPSAGVTLTTALISALSEICLLYTSCACIPFSCNGVDEKYLFHRGAPSAQ